MDEAEDLDRIDTFEIKAFTKILWIYRFWIVGVQSDEIAQKLSLNKSALS